MSSIIVEQHDLNYETDEVIFDIEKGAVRKFAEAIGDQNPIYYDEDYAKTTVFGTIIAPPTFVATFREKQRITIKGIKGTRVHGGQEYYYYAPLKVGMKIKCKTKFIDLYKKSSKNQILTFAVFEQTGRDVETGNIIFIGKRTSIYRERKREEK